MATTSDTTLDIGHEPAWTAGGIAGVIAGIPFGLLIQYVVGAMGAVGALWGFPGHLAAGWIIHLINSLVFGLVFAWALSTDPLSWLRDRWFHTTGAGLVYGALLWLVFLVFVWPIWLGVVGFPPGAASLPVPYVTMKPLIGHLVYGAVLGVVYPYIAT